MSMSYKCTVVHLTDPEDHAIQVFSGSCGNQATEEVYTEDIEAVNEKLSPDVLVGNFICDHHAELVGDI